MTDSPGVGPCGIDDLESDAALVGCVASLGVGPRPTPGERKDEMGNESRDAVALLFPACILDCRPSLEKETVIIEVYETTTLTFTVPSDVMTRRSVLLGVILVDVSSEELCLQLVWVVSVFGLPEATALEGETGRLRLFPLTEPRGGSGDEIIIAVPDETSLISSDAVIEYVSGIPGSPTSDGETGRPGASPLTELPGNCESGLRTEVPDEFSLIWSDAVLVVGSTTVGRDPGSSVED